ncbi:XdhC family protein [Peptoniphilus sp. AGMB00490]|uniref:XdhC family protein n=1 Tax=Peptoniphilus faecalis TaxID=2731255 RepID=A0A848RJL0_9FIRM|nr:XdhC/CoxI family protein [Peptoniphilus faecalis]NMW85599.1 XdhC family protein [Peptoniphilus faecalis]
MIDIVKDAIYLCRKKEPFVMASIIFKHGSAPREVGATMIITEKGYYSGTIGGGEQEFQAINHAKNLISTKKCDQQFYEVSKEVAAEKGMVCGGQTRVHFQYIDIENYKNEEYFEKLLSEVEDHNVYLVYDISKEDSNFGIAIEIDGKIFPFTGEENPKRNLFKIKIKRPMRVFIFGGGHISRATVKVLDFLGLNINVVDDREDFISQKEFEKTKRIVIDFDKLDSIDIEKSDYVLIMTRGHKYDIKVLESVLKKEPYYIGVVGNKIKAKKYREHFLGGDLEGEYEKKVHLPVGIKISALTPEEIAISIAGEIIESYRTNV